MSKLIGTKAFSWRIIDHNTAVKECDKTVWDHNETVIPKEITSFFSAENLAPGNLIKVNLIFRGEEFEGTIKKEVGPRSSVRLSWKSDLAERFHPMDLVSGPTYLSFCRLGGSWYSVDISHVVEDDAKSAWLLSWNRANYPWEEYEEDCNNTDIENPYDAEWTCAAKKPKIGDHVFIIKLGSQPRGIVGHGVVLEESFARPHYIQEKADKGETENAIGVAFDCLLDYQKGEIIPQAILAQECPGQQWSPMGSGISINQNVLPALWNLWDAIVERKEEIVVKDGPEEETMTKYNLNQILYGPPGTGKTYSAIEVAASICGVDVVSKSHAMIQEEYDKLVNQGRIVFTTFHQSYGYEEFIEGIRPIMDSDDSGELKYEIQDGVFKKLCKAAETPENPDINHNASIWYVRLKDGTYNDLKKECFDAGVIRFEAPKDIEDTDNWLYSRLAKMKPGDFVVSYGGKSVYIDAIGIVEDEECYYDESKSSYRWTLGVKWLLKNVSIDVLAINNNHYLPNFSISSMKHMKISDLLQIVAEHGGAIYKKNEKPYVLIIDEINRGNISKIFGELITLIEDTKRAGAPEAMEAVLPYSGETFSVPSNVYILGTMNTADRSIALMDTALRRRFDFVELMPNSSVLDAEGIGRITENGKTISVSKMLDVINQRIEFLYDREHMLGHALFMRLKEENSIRQLATIFEDKVIPLLQEYFYNDYEKIQLVLGDNGKSDDSLKIILDKDLKATDLFKGNPDVDLPEKGYSIQFDALSNIQTYKEIGEDL